RRRPRHPHGGRPRRDAGVDRRAGLDAPVSARVAYDREAREHLRAYLLYVLEQSQRVETVARQEQRVTDGLALIASMPGIGRRARGAGLRPGTRVATLRDVPLQAFYEPIPGGIRVLQLRHGRRAPL